MPDKKELTLDNGLRVAYWEYHPDAAITMVLIHGFTGSHEGFQYIIPLLPEVHFIVPDLPGFGESELPPRTEWTIDGLARLADEFVRHLTLALPPAILGHSMGGLVVSSMVAQAPRLYGPDVILISPVPTSVRVADSRKIGMIMGALQYRIGARAGQVGERVVKSRTISRALTRLLLQTKDVQRRQEIYRHHLKNLDYISDLNFYERIYTDTNRLGAVDYADELVKKRILLLAGDRDGVTPLREEKKLAALVHPETFTIIPHVGHLIHYEKAPEAAEAIRQFLLPG